MPKVTFSPTSLLRTMFPSESKPQSYSEFFSRDSFHFPQEANNQLNYISSPAASPPLPSPPSIHPTISQQAPVYYSRMYELPGPADPPQSAFIPTQPSPQSSLGLYRIASPLHTTSSPPSVQRHASRYAAQRETSQSASFSIQSSPMNPSSMNTSQMHNSSLQNGFVSDTREFAYPYEQGHAEPKQWSLPRKPSLSDETASQESSHVHQGHVRQGHRSHSLSHKYSTSKEHIHEHQTHTSTMGRARRRSSTRSATETVYPTYYPAHPVPPEMQIATGPPDSWSVTPPRPEKIRRRKYASGVDERNFFTVLEYEINSQPIIWDYFTGYVHLTGIWKAIGNSKADIVKLLDNSPELEPVIKRVRGGFLKIQGTWVPYEVARKLALHVCFYVRYALVPLFGATFPEQCTRPTEPGFGTLQLKAPRTLAESGHQNKSRPASASVKSPIAHVGSISPGAPVLLESSPYAHSSQYANQNNATLGSPRTLSSGSGSNHPHLLCDPPSFHMKSASDSGFKRRISPIKYRTNSTPAVVPQSESINHALSISREAYDENVLVDEDTSCISPPPMPRKVSFSDERIISESPSEFLAMLKATRSLQQMSSGRFVKELGGGFECGGRQFIWDGIDKLDILPIQQTSNSKAVTPPRLAGFTAKSAFSATPHHTTLKPEPSPPLESTAMDRRSPSLAKILNI